MTFPIFEKQIHKLTKTERETLHRNRMFSPEAKRKARELCEFIQEQHQLVQVMFRPESKGVK